jgi:RNA polymerase sigma-70 factor
MIESRNSSRRIDLATEERFMRLFLESERRVFGFILSLVPHWADAEDVLQETVAVMWRKFEEFEPNTDFLAWAVTVARFQVLCHRKKQQRSRVRFSDQTLEALADRLIAFNETSDRRLDALWHCLGLLPCATAPLPTSRCSSWTACSPPMRRPSSITSNTWICARRCTTFRAR